MGGEQGLLGAVGLSPLSEQVYLFAVHRGRTMIEDVAQAFDIDVDTAAAILDELRDIGLIALPEVPGGAYAPVDPEIALGAVVDRLSAQAAVLRDRIPALVEQFRNGESVDHEVPMTLVLTDPVEVASWYARLQHQAKTEMLTFDRPPYISLGMEPLQVNTIARGVSWRVVYAAESFARADAWDETVRMSEQGEQARVASSLPFKVVVVDRSIALLGLRLDGASVESMVTESPPLVRLLVDTFEFYWARALPLAPGGASTTAEIREALTGSEPAVPVSPAATASAPPTREQQAILALIGAGLTDEVIAARLGLSVRSLRRRSQRLMHDLGADNRFQLGVRAARRGWV
jgi:DNA-binding CsgD family transcriptional regulator